MTNHDAPPPATPADQTPTPGAVLFEMALVFSPILLIGPLSSMLGASVAVAGSLDAAAIVLSMLAATVALRRRGGGWRGVGLTRPRNWLITIGVALAVVVAAIVINIVLQVGMALLLPSTEAPDMSRFDVLRGNLPMLIVGIAGVWVTAAFGEEMLVRGYMMNRFAGLFGGTTGAWIGAVALSSILFGLMHLYQGAMGVILTGVAGAVFGAAYLLAGRSLWPVIIAHGIIDTLAFVAFYFGAVPGE